MADTDISPFAFQEPLSPFMAAQLENKTVTLANVREHWTRIQHRHRFFTAEGAGGLSVPLGADFLVSDVARLIGLPLLIVARPNLGTLNHTYLTVHYARHAGLEIAGIIINGMPENPGLAEQTAPAEMERLCGVPVLAVVPQLAQITDEAVEQMAAQHLQSVIAAAGVTQ